MSSHCRILALSSDSKNNEYLSDLSLTLYSCDQITNEGIRDLGERLKYVKSLQNISIIFG